MKMYHLFLTSSLCVACAPGAPLTSDRGKAQPSDNQTVTIDTTEYPVTDGEEDDKADEPGIIGGAYLYCDSSTDQAGCRLANVPAEDWFTADKTPAAINATTGKTEACPIVLPSADDPFQVILEAEQALQSSLKLQVDITLPQGPLRMTTTVNPTSPQATAQRLKPGLALYASKNLEKGWQGIDQKTWNLWMPVKIPAAISSFTGGSERVELIFDETVCSYQKEKNDYLFDTCSRSTWKVDQTVRVKSLSLRVTEGSAGVVLTTP